MLDLNFVRDNFERVRAALDARNFPAAALEDFARQYSPNSPSFSLNRLSPATTTMSSSTPACLSTRFRSPMAPSLFESSVEWSLTTVMPGPPRSMRRPSAQRSKCPANLPFVTT